MPQHNIEKKKVTWCYFFWFPGALTYVFLVGHWGMLVEILDLWTLIKKFYMVAMTLNLLSVLNNYLKALH